MSCLAHRTWTTRFALWAAVCALLLNAAAPMLASASAQLQGRTLVEVCTAYGVATVVLDATGKASEAPEPAAPHPADHCVLGGLFALAVPSSTGAAGPGKRPAAHAVGEAAGTTGLPADAAARWAALRMHGPPAHS